MILRLQIFNWRFTFTFAPTTRVVGVNSTLPDGNHILMWDFDDVNENDVIFTLQEVQDTYLLPRIYILETKRGKNYIAYCFKRTGWRKAVEIIAYTPNVDWGFLKYGIYREKFTLRVSPKCGRKPKLIYVLESDVKEDVFVHDLKSWVRYQTLPDNYKPERIEIKGVKDVARKISSMVG